MAFTLSKEEKTTNLNGNGRPINGQMLMQRGGTQELIRDEENGRCLSVETAEALAGAIQVYVERPDVRTAHGQAAKSSAENKFSREQFVKGWIQAFDGVGE